SSSRLRRPPRPPLLPYTTLFRSFSMGTQEERFRDLALTRSPHGVPMLADTDTAAWFECYNGARHRAGDHTIFVGQVERCERRYRSEEHTSELQSRENLVCRLLLE